MVIVAGWLRVEPGDRAHYLDECRSVIVDARQAPGCLDFHLSADAIDPARVNVYERWADRASVERFRSDGASDEQQRMIVAAQVMQFQISDVTPLT